MDSETNTQTVTTEVVNNRAQLVSNLYGLLGELGKASLYMAAFSAKTMESANPADIATSNPKAKVIDLAITALKTSSEITELICRVGETTLRLEGTDGSERGLLQE